MGRNIHPFTDSEGSTSTKGFKFTQADMKTITPEYLIQPAMIMKEHQQNRLQRTINKNMADLNCSKSSGIKLLCLNLDL